MEDILNKIKTAIEFLKDGESYTIGDLRLEIQENDTVNVMGWSEYANFENLTRSQTVKELAAIKNAFKQMLELSSELRGFIGGKGIEYSLYFDDYGKASIPICSEKEGVVKWEADI